MDWESLKNLHRLDQRQEQIAAAPADSRQLVLAPPGTGKTHIVVARILHLLCVQGLQPWQFAVLCFTRAAVAEILSRVTRLVEEAGLHDDLRFVTIRTFDSFATKLLLDANPDRELEDEGYDSRIANAVAALSDPGSTEARSTRQIRHLIVDEIQDLVGVRAQLVQKLIERVGGGFTLLGDPAQAIYDWSIADSPGALTPTELLRWLRGQPWAASLIEPKIDEGYRLKGEAAAMAHELRESIISAEAGATEPLSRLRGLVKGLESAGTARAPGGILGSGDHGSVCVLCRSNGEVMQVAHFLSSSESNAGAGVHTRPNPEDRGLPAWLGRVLGGYRASDITRATFLERWAQLVEPGRGPDPQAAWQKLKRLEGDTGQSLSVRRLHHRLYAGHRLPDSDDAYLEAEATTVSVSTIHASKGREFDHVIVLDPAEGDSGQQGNQLEEARVLYVATTRAKKSLQRLERSGLPRLWSVDMGDGRKRWVAHVPGRNMYLIEIGLQGDFDGLSTVSTWDHPNEESAQAVQDLLWLQMQRCSVVNIHQYRTGQWRFYKVYEALADGSDGQRIGQLSKVFRDDLVPVLRSVKGEKWSYPLHMNGVRVATVVSEVLPPYPKDVYEPFATSGLCLGIRLRGMGFLSK
jgi:DNA helicase-2/ATP-dependent DNA helicase PcrA